MSTNSFVSTFKKSFSQFFPDAEEPVVFFYSSDERYQEFCKPNKLHCIIAQLRKVRKGQTIALDASTVNCGGGKHYLGFDDPDDPAYAKTKEPNFMECFLAEGIPGVVEGERYKKTPFHSRSYYEGRSEFSAPERFAVFKPLSELEADETPALAIFFARPSTLSDLYNLANYDWHGDDAVFTPWGSGCCSIVADPYQESLKPADEQRGIIGMFDAAARPFIGEDELSFSVPWERLKVMTANMAESYLSEKRPSRKKHDA